MTPLTPFTLCATLMHTPVRGALDIAHEALVDIDAHGTITSVRRQQDAGYAAHKAQCAQNSTLRTLPPDCYVLPGLIDLHVHAPQWPQTGKALHLPLADWLQKNTFPLEARYADLDFARNVYTSLIETLLANGTTTAMYYATAHVEPTLLLAQLCLEKGQRALIGTVAMDHPDECPPFYCAPSAQAALDDTASCIEGIRALPGNQQALIRPVVTPRFIPSCTDTLLDGLGQLAQQHDCHVQTHCSESDWEHDHVLQRFGKTDTAALHDFGLLRRGTVLAHGNYINDDDIALLNAQGAAIAHCPLSNFYFANSVFPLRHALDRHLHVGLATDLAGGHSPFMLDACRQAITASKALQDGVDPSLPAAQRGRGPSQHHIDFREALWLATTGAGLALDLPIGFFAPGYAWDAIVINPAVADSNVLLWPELDDDEDILQKIFYNASRSNIVQTWVQGRCVHTRANASS